MSQGKVVRIIGPVIDVEFPEDHLPAILNAVRIRGRSSPDAEEIDVTAEVEQHLGENRVRCVAMEPTEGMVRGMEADGSGRAHHRARGARDPGPHHQRRREAGGREGAL